MAQVMTRDEALQKYGPIENGSWVNEAEYCVMVEIPDYISETWINSATGLPTKHIYCNKDMGPSLLSSIHAVYDRGFYSELKTFDGCFVVRDTRGRPGEISAHSLALAIDVNAKENPLCGPSQLSQGFVKCFTDFGFTWGGVFQRMDPMHFSYAGF